MQGDCRCKECLCWKAVKRPKQVCDLCLAGNHPGDKR